jgi:predicted ATPase
LLSRASRSKTGVNNIKVSQKTSTRQVATSTKKSEKLWTNKWKLIAGTSILATPITYLLVNPVKAQETTSELNKSSQGSGEDDWDKTKEEFKRTAPIFRVVLTGGPCGGKSTAMAQISDRLSSLGVKVFRVPEAATILLSGTGLSFSKFSRDQLLAFETNLVKTQMALEDSFVAIARSTRSPCVVLCDRGVMDTKAYLSSDLWSELLSMNGWDPMTLRDKRYDAVVHLVTAAIGAEKFYTTENNTARSETIEQARELDFKLMNSYVGHPIIRIVDNSTDFKGKITRVTDALCQIVGAPRPADYRRKFLVKDFNLNELKKVASVEEFDVEYTFLNQEEGEDINGYTCLRKRGRGKDWSYTHSTTRRVEDSQRAIVERPISAREYSGFLKSRDLSRGPVTKHVYCFVHDNVYYELQTVRGRDSVVILTSEIERSKKLSLPKFVQIASEVTDDPDFSSYYLSKVKK